MKYSICLILFLIFNGLSLAQQTFPNKCSPAVDVRQTSVHLENFALVVADLPQLQSWATAQNWEIVGAYEPANILVLRVSQQDLAAKILPRPDVLFVDRAKTNPHDELSVPGHNLFVNKINTAHSVYPNLNGTDMTISVKESRFDTADVDLKNRTAAAPNATQQITVHAGITATLIGGAGNSDLAGQGVAWRARLVSHGFNNLLPDGDYATQNVSVQNHSYGVDIENYYGAGALAYDVSTVQNPSLLHVFSAGNKGLEASNTGAYANVPGFANLTGNFKMTKNTLTVGAVDSFGQVAPFSSRGPAYDGRLKPDLTAFGQDGTSGAAALVSGAAALLQQALREQTGSLPDAALVRAVLLNSADDIASPGPDFYTGFGNLNLKNALKAIANQQFETEKLGDGETRTFALELPPNTARLKITLAWDDALAAPNASKALVDDLDLTVLAPDGSVWLPWVLSHFPDADSLRAPAARRRDTLNNTEQITLDFPQPGQWAVQVSGTKIQTASQHFSLAWDWTLSGDFAWDFPVKNDAATAGRDVLLRWENSLADSTGLLEYRLSGDTDWQLIDPAANLKKGWHRWQTPDIFAEAQLRIRTGNASFESDTFLIFDELRLKIGFNCPDSVLLSWNAAAPGARYALSGLGDRYLEPLLLLTDTFAVLKKADFPQTHFSVAPLGLYGAKGLRSPAPDISKQGVACYFENFLAELNDEGHTDLKLQIGTTWGVQAIGFEKWENGAFQPLTIWQMPGTDFFSFADTFPRRGSNRYRARLDLKGGATLFSDMAEVFLADGAALIFPNPAAPGVVLSVLYNASEQAVFVLFDVLGKTILEHPLEGARTDVALPEGLPRGVYFWAIGTRGKVFERGKIVSEF